MPLFYFDMTDQIVFRDEDGLEFEDNAAAQRQAMRALTAYAAEGAIEDREQQTFTILVSNAKREAIYSATLTLSGRTIL